MRIHLDTDVLLDVALERAEFFQRSASVVRWAETHPGNACVAWHSLSNLAYLIRPDARGFIADLLQFVEVARVGTEEAQAAVALPISDFEDAMQSVSALAFRADYLVTRNLADYRRSPVKAISPQGFLKRVGIRT